MSYYQVLAHHPAAAVAPKPAERPVVKRRRARHPAESEDAKPGTFVADDPATPENEAWVG